MDATKFTQILNQGTQTNPTVTSGEEAQLGTNDRCDACGAQAYVLAEMPFGVLLFCAHHAKSHAEKISQIATKIIDETYRIQA